MKSTLTKGDMMKGIRIAVFIILVLFTQIHTDVFAFADVNTTENEKATENAAEIGGENNEGQNIEEQTVKVDLNGKYIEFNKDTGIPYIDENQRTMVPLRLTMEKMGCQILWNQENKTVVVTGRHLTNQAAANGQYTDGTEQNAKEIKVTVPVGEKWIAINEEKIPMDTEAVIRDGRVYLPIRKVAEAFGGNVNWNGKMKTVIIEKGEKPYGQVHFINVGHGDATFIDIGEYEMLVDTGDEYSGTVVSNYIKPYVDGNLELVIATHGHHDHIGGIPELLSRYKVDRIITSGSKVDTDIYRDYERALNSIWGLNITEDKDEAIQIDDKTTLEIMEIFDNTEIENNNSVVSLLKIGNIKVLLTGDSQNETDEAVGERAGKVDVFKAAHHGSINANGKALMDKIMPGYIVVSAGRGIGYKHPHITSMKRMLDTGAIIYGTFKSGNIVMTTDGLSYYFQRMENQEGQKEAVTDQLVPLTVLDSGTLQRNI